MDSSEDEACEPVADGMMRAVSMEGRLDLEANAGSIGRAEQLKP